jgi:transketolase
MNNKVSLRDSFGKALAELGKEKKDLVGLTADLESSTRLSAFHQSFPDRFYQLGVAEQNLIGVSAGLAMRGFIPFACSFATFLTGRAWEQIRVCLCLNKLNVKLVGSHAGLSHPSDGVTAQGTEDIGLMQGLPQMQVVYPADAKQMQSTIAGIYNQPGPVYLRMTREPTPIISGLPKSFIFGKAQLVKNGKDLTFVSSGPILNQVLEAAKRLQQEGINCEIINLPTIKPLDIETIKQSVERTNNLVVVEDHQTKTGIGSAIINQLPKQNFNYLSVGIKDAFTTTARNYQQLLTAYQLDGESIFKKVLSFCSDV